ncbi:Hypothetical predicted protein, partial [Mytilus galloprovincialis]
FELHTDASMQGLGAVLYQEQENKKCVIADASRGLSKTERNYPVHKLEFLALQWAVTEKFHDYLYGNTFTVLTDNRDIKTHNDTEILQKDLTELEKWSIDWKMSFNPRMLRLQTKHNIRNRIIRPYFLHSTNWNLKNITHT